MNVDYPIDAVITWVDGNDVNWQQKINPYLEKKIDWSNKKETIRFQSIDEISYCVKSIIRFAPFIRTIFIVTDNQVPTHFETLKALGEKEGIQLRIVDHKELFKGFEHYLPVFNARSIGPLFYKIKELSEHFLFFNDDFFLMKKTEKTDFFENGYPVIRGVWANFYENRLLRRIYLKLTSLINIKARVIKVGTKKAQQTSAKMLGFNKYFKLHHTPMAIRKSTIKSFFDENPEILENNIKYRFRNENQFLISSFSNHLEIKNKTCVLKKDLQLSYFQSYKYFFIIKLKLWLFKIDNTKLFMCFQSLEMTNKKTFKYIINWLDNRLDI